LGNELAAGRLWEKESNGAMNGLGAVRSVGSVSAIGLFESLMTEIFNGLAQTATIAVNFF
jgi:hypothetical protein